MSNKTILILSIIYVISVLVNYGLYSKPKRKLDMEDKTIIFTPVINTISLIIELWDLTIKKR